MISGYSDHYRVLQGDHLEKLRSEFSGRSETVLEKNKKLSAETNKRRKQLEEKWKQHEEAEERRRMEVLLARKARLKAATEKYQKSGVPLRGRTPTSARHRSRSSSLPLQFDASPRRAGSAADVASTIERALQAIRSEIPNLLRPSPPSGAAAHHGPAAAAQQHLRQQQLLGGGAHNRSAHVGFEEDSSKRVLPANVNDRSSPYVLGGSDYGVVANGSAMENWDGTGASRHGSAARSLFERELLMRRAANVQKQERRPADVSSGVLQEIGTEDSDRAATYRGGVPVTGMPGAGVRNDATAGQKASEQHIASHVTANKEIRASNDDMESDGKPCRTSLDSLDGDLSDTKAGSGRALEQHRGVTNAAPPVLSRGFSTWRAAEEFAYERAQNPHLQTETLDELLLSKRPSAPQSRLLEASAESCGSAAHVRPQPLNADANSDFVQWQPVTIRGLAPSSATQRTSARTLATPVAGPQSGVYLSTTLGSELAAEKRTVLRDGSQGIASGPGLRADPPPFAAATAVRGAAQAHSAASAATATSYGRSTSGATAAALSGGQILTVHSLSRTAGGAGHVVEPHQQPVTGWGTENGSGDGSHQRASSRTIASSPGKSQTAQYGFNQQPFSMAAGDMDRGLHNGYQPRVDAAFDVESAYSDSVASLSSRGIVKGILKRTGDDDSSVHSVRSEQGGLISSKQKSLSTPNIRDSVEMTKRRSDHVKSQAETPRKKSVRFMDSDTEGDGAESEASGRVQKLGDKVPACWISPAHALDLEELQSSVTVREPASADFARPASASAAAQKPPAPPSARTQRAASAAMAALARRRSIPAASKLPIHRRWPAANDASDGSNSVTAAAAPKDNDKLNSNASADDVSGAYLGRTPTDEEINNLWHTVRSCLSSGAPAETASASSASSAAAPSALPAGGGVQSPTVVKVTADNLVKLGRANGIQRSLMQHRAASDPSLGVSAATRPYEQQQHQLYDEHQGHLAPGSTTPGLPAARSNKGSYPQAPAPSKDEPSLGGASVLAGQSGRTASAGQQGHIMPSGPAGHATPAGLAGTIRRNVTTSMAAFLAAEEMAASPLASESQIARTVRNVEFQHRPAGMHPAPAPAHFRPGSKGRKNGTPMSALSLEEQKLLQSLEVLNERLKITEAAATVATQSPKSDVRTAPSSTWSTAHLAASSNGYHRGTDQHYTGRQHWAEM